VGEEPDAPFLTKNRTPDVTESKSAHRLNGTPFRATNNLKVPATHRERRRSMRNPTSMLVRTSFAAALFLLLGQLTLAAASVPAPGTITVGDFLLLYARSTHIALPADATPELAYAALKAAGSLPSDPMTLAAPLTHAVVLQVGRAAGLRLTSRTPDQAFPRAEAEAFLQTYSGVIVAHRTGSASETYGASFNPPGDPAGHANTSKGKKKGRPFQSTNLPGNANGHDDGD